MERPRRGNYRITEAGREILGRFPQGVSKRELNELGDDQSSKVQPYQPSRPRMRQAVSMPEAAVEEMTPIEQVQAGIARVNGDVATELLKRLQWKEPGFFEQAVVDLLLAMGYGGVNGAGRVTQVSHDGGIDGVIDQDVLGVSRVYVQAKRYAEGNTVGRQVIQAFVGALSGRADSGVFFTTSRFTDDARRYAQSVPTRIILIDGERLTQLMIRYGVGVQIKQTFHAVEIDEDFFA